MRTRMYGGVRGRKTKVGGKSTFVFLLLDSSYLIFERVATLTIFALPKKQSYVIRPSSCPYTVFDP